MWGIINISTIYKCQNKNVCLLNNWYYIICMTIIMLVYFNIVPIRTYVPLQYYFPLVKGVEQIDSVSWFKASVVFLFNASTDSKYVPLRIYFTLWKRKMSHGAKYSEYGRMKHFLHNSGQFFSQLCQNIH